MTTLAEIMTTDVATVAPDMSLREALDVLRSRNVSGAPVVRDAKVAGVVSAADLLEFEATAPRAPTRRPDDTDVGEFETAKAWEEGDESPSTFFIYLWSDVGVDAKTRMEETDAPEWDVLEEHSVSEIMTRQVVALAPEADVVEGARLMTRAGVHRLLVMRGSELVGVVSTADIVRWVADSGA